MKKNIFLILAFAIFTQIASSQNEKTIKIIGLDYLTKDFYFDGKIFVTEAIFEVDEKIKFLDFNFFAKIAKGRLKISILDPNGRG